MIVNLKITTWQGISLGAEHYYAKLQGDDKTVELQDTLTKQQATRLNKKAYATGYSFDVHAPGDKHRGFDTREDAVEAGKREWLNYFPKAKFLVLGNRTYHEPKPILVSTVENTDSLKEKAQTIVDKCEAIGLFDDPNNDLMDKYCNEWDALFN